MNYKRGVTYSEAIKGDFNPHHYRLLACRVLAIPPAIRREEHTKVLLKKTEAEVAIGISVMFVFETTFSREGDEGPWVRLVYQAGRCLFSPHIFAPCFLTFVRRVHSRRLEYSYGLPLRSRFIVFQALLIG